MQVDDDIRNDATVGADREREAAPAIASNDAMSAMSPALAVKPGTPDQSGVSQQTLVVDTVQPTVKSDITERQAVEVKPMRYVLLIGLGLAIVAMLVVWLLFR